MKFLSKEATNKDQILKMQMMLSLYKDDSSNSQKLWKKNVFFEIKKVILQLRNQTSLKILWYIVIREQFLLLDIMQFILTMWSLHK